MLIVVTGGSGSGKSEYAENTATALAENSLIYIATMVPYGEEGKRRVERHRKLRAGKGFETVECFTDISSLKLKGNPTVLLECMSNLTANEIYETDGAHENAFESITAGIEHLEKICDNVVIVTNEVFSDGMSYDEETLSYMSTLGKINDWLGRRADRLVEVVYSIPIEKK